MLPDLLIDVTRLIWRRWAGRHPTGIDRVCLAYLERYHLQAQAVIQYPNFRRILAPDLSQRLFQLLLHDHGNFRMQLIGFGLRNISSALKPWPSLGRYYLNVGHTGLDQKGHLEWVQRSGVRPIYFVHDLIPITHPEFCREAEAERHKVRMVTVLRAACGIIGNSADTLQILTKFAKTVGLPVPKMITAHLGTAEIKISQNDLISATNPYFVILSTIEGRKNHMLLLDVWQKMIASDIQTIPQLLIIGQRGWKCEHVTDRLDNDQQLKPYITELSKCTDEEIYQYLRGGKALLFPSFAEGFGMPLMEALMVGTPVIASDLAVFREIAGDVPEYLDPNDRETWLKTILQYQTEPSAERETQCRRMKAIKLPSWPDHFKKIDYWLSLVEGQQVDAN